MSKNWLNVKRLEVIFFFSFLDAKIFSLRWPHTHCDVQNPGGSYSRFAHTVEPHAFLLLVRTVCHWFSFLVFVKHTSHVCGSLLIKTKTELFLLSFRSAEIQSWGREGETAASCRCCDGCGEWVGSKQTPELKWGGGGGIWRGLKMEVFRMPLSFPWGTVEYQSAWIVKASWSNLIPKLASLARGKNSFTGFWGHAGVRRGVYYCGAAESLPPWGVTWPPAHLT